MMSVIGKIKILMYLQIVYSFSIGLFGLVFWLDNWFLIVIVSSIARILQGSAVGGISTIVYSYVPRLFSHKQNKVISYLEMSVGLSMAFGQTLGSLLYFIFGKPQIVMILLSLLYYLTMQYFCI
jgi:MFS family permease